MASLELAMADPSLPFVIRSWCIEKRVCFASSLYSSCVLALESIDRVSGRLLMGLPVSSQCRCLRTSYEPLTSRADLQFDCFASHDEERNS